MVKYKQGKVAAAAYNRQRRLPAFVVGSVLFSFGVVLTLLSILFGEEIPGFGSFGVLGFIFCLMPGLTIGLLSVLPGDDSLIQRWMVFLLCISGVFGCAWAYDAVWTSSALFGEDGGACMDYRAMVVPCWVSAAQVVGFALLSVLCFEVVCRRILVSLYTKRNVEGRFELLWKCWSRWLIGYSIANMFFIVPYTGFADGRNGYVRSVSWALEIASTITTAALGAFAFTKKWYTATQNWLATFGTVVNAMAVATLMSHGDQPLEEVMSSAKEQLRYVYLSSMDMADFNCISDSGPSRDKCAKSVRCQPRDIDLFICHSWHDPPLPKWDALSVMCAEFSALHGREPRLWVDVYCRDPDSGSEPHLHPVFLMASEKLVVLQGPTLMTRIWCCMEIFMFVEAGGAASSIDVLPIAGCTLSEDDVDVTTCECSAESDMVAMSEVVNACGSVANFDNRLRDILRGIAFQMAQVTGQDNDTETGAVIRKRPRRLSGVIRLTDELSHLARQFERFVSRDPICPMN